MYRKYVVMHIRSLAQYPSSFWMAVFSQLLLNFAEYAGMYLLFQRFNSIAGWSFAEASLCFGVVHFSFASVECFAKGFDQFQGLVKKGEYDRLLVRPRGTILQVFGSSFDLTRLGKLVQSAFVLAYTLSIPGIQWNASRAMTLLLMIISGMAIFTAIFIVGATICFFTVEGLEAFNIFTYGGQEIASYPLSIYHGWVRRFFTFVVPFGCFNYLPMLYITGRATAHAVLYLLTPLYGFLFLIPALLIWKFGEKHYLSTGS